MNHGSFRGKRTTGTPYGSLCGIHTQACCGGVYESAEGGVCGSMCPYMGSVRLGELCSVGNAGRFLECLVAFVCARHESKTQTRS